MMEELDLRGTRVSDSGLRHLASTAEQLRVLKLAHRNYNLWVDGLYTEDGLKDMQQLRPDLDIRLMT
jgi:hypothetical protein